MLTLFHWLADSRFMPHGMCYLWQPEVLWPHAISDSVTALAYYFIAFDLFFFVKRRKDLPFHWVFTIFGVFILGCGTTHLMEVVTIWHPVYRLSGTIKVLTAIASVGAAVSLFPLLSRVLAPRGVAHLERSNRRLDHKVMAGFGLALATLVAVGVLQYRTVQMVIEADRQVAHAHAVLAQLEGAFSDVKDAESSGRGYVATGDERYVKPIELSIGNIQGHLGALRSLTLGYPHQQRNVDKLAPLVERRVAFTERLILVRRNQGFDAATHLMRQGEGLRLMSEIRALVEVIGAEENGSLQARLAASRAGARKAGAVVDLGTALALVLLFAASWVIHRDIIRWRRAEETRAYLASIVESSEDAIIGKRLDGTVVSWNPGAERLYGYTAEEAIGRPISMLLPPHRADDTLDILERIKREEGVERYETKCLRRDGGETEVSLTVSPIRNRDGGVVGASVIARDITERRRAEEALRRQTELEMHTLQILVAEAPAGLVMLDRKMRQIQASQRWIDDLGLKREAVIGKYHYETLPNIPAHWKEAHRRGLGGEVVSGADDRLVTPDGKEHRVNWEMHPWGDDGEDTGGIIIYFDDITERKSVEEAARKSELQYRGLFEHMSEGLAYCRMLFENGQGRDFIYLAVNHAFETATGLRDVAGKRVTEIIPGIRESDPSLLETYARVALTGKPEKFETFVRALGSWFSISVYSPEREFFVAIFDVINDRKRAEAENLRLATAIEQAAEGVMVTDVKARIEYVNPAFTKMTGYSRAQAVGRNPRFLRSGRQSRAFYQEMWATILSGKVWQGELVNRRKDGSFYMEELTIAPVKDPHGLTTHFIAIKQDVTERKRAEQALTASEICYRRLFEASRDGILLLDAATGGITDANPFVLHLLGYGREEILGKKLWEIGPFWDVSASQGAFQRLHAGGYIRYDDLPLETKDGNHIDVEFVSNEYWAGDKKVVQCNIRDVTDRKRQENQIQASLREKEILLREIHHRVKNNMQLISSLYGLEMGPGRDGPAREAVREVRDRIRSMALIHEKLYRSRDLARIEFAEYLRSLAAELFRLYRPDPEAINLRIESGGVWLDLDTAIPCGLIVNELLSNCLKHGFPEGRKGQIEVTLSSADDHTVKLVVSDDGVGLPAGFNFRETESFGSQLVKMLVEQLGGSIALESEGGTRFEIAFPASKR